MTLGTNTSTENAKKLWESVDQLDCPFLNIEKYRSPHHYTYEYSDGVLFKWKGHNTICDPSISYLSKF